MNTYIMIIIIIKLLIILFNLNLTVGLHTQLEKQKFDTHTIR